MSEIKVSLLLEMVDRLTAPMQKATKAASGFPAAGDNVARAQDKIANSSRKVSSATAAAAQSQDKLKVSSVAVADALNKQVTATDKLSRAREMLSKMVAPAAVAGAGYGALQAGKATIGAVSPFVEEAMKQESAFADVRKVVDFDDAADMQAFKDQIQGMSREIPIATDGLYAIAAAAGQLGVKKDQIDDFTRTVSMMSTAFDMTANEAGDSMAKIANIYKIPISELADVGDVINHLSNTSAAKANEMVNVMTRVGGIGKEFGLTTTQVAALSSTFLALGKPPEVAATGINALLLKMRTATNQNKDFRAALTDIGYTAKSLESGVLKDAQGTLTTFLDKLNNLKPEKRMNVLADLFGAEYADDISTLVGGLDEYKKALNQVGDEGNYAFSMQAEFEARAATSANALQLMQNRMSEVKNEVGSALLPAFNEAIQALSPWITKMAEWARANPEITKGIAMAVVVVGGLSAAIGGVLLVLAPLLAGFAMLKGGFGIPDLFGGKSKPEAASADTKQAVGDGEGVADEAADTISRKLAEAGVSGIKNLVSNFAGDQLGEAGENLVKDLTAPLQQFGLDGTAANYLNAGAESAIGKFEEMGTDAIDSLLTGAYNKAQGAGQSVMTRINGALSRAGGGLRLIRGNPFAGLTTGLRSGTTVIGRFAASLRGGLTRGLSLLGSGARVAGQAIMWMGRALMMNPIGLIITAIAAAAYLIYRNWGSIGPWFANMWNRVKASFTAAKAALSNMSWGGIVAKIVMFFAQLPFKLLKIGTEAIGKLAVGIMTSMGIPEARARAIVANMISVFFGLPGKLMEMGKQAIAGLANGIKAAGSEALQAAKNIASDIGSAVSGFFQIRSPSRLMMSFGHNISTGLAVGLEKAGHTPVAQMLDIAQRIAGIPMAANDPTFAALGNPLGNVIPFPQQPATLPRVTPIGTPKAQQGNLPKVVPVGTPKAPAGGNKAATAPASNNTFNITINAAPGMDAQAIAREVQRQIEQHERRKARRTDSRLYDEVA